MAEPQKGPDSTVPPPYPGNYSYYYGFDPLAASSYQAINDVTRLSLASTQAYAVMGTGLASVAARFGVNLQSMLYPGVGAAPTRGAAAPGGQPPGASAYPPYAPYPWPSASPLLLSRYFADAVAETAKVVAVAADSFAKVYGAGATPPPSAPEPAPAAKK